jgi:hypothetical protein
LNIPDLKISTKYLIAILVLVKILGVVFATEVFARFTPLVDSKLYLDGYYTADPFFRTRVIQWLATAVNSWGGGDYLAHLTFAMISALGLAYYYLTGGRRWILILTLLLPSSLVWSSIVGKEAIFFGGMGLGLVIWSKYTVSSLNWVDIIIAALAIGVCAALRPHYLVALLWLFLATALFKRLEGKAWISLLLLFIVGALAIYFVDLWEHGTLWEELTLRGWGGIDATARASRFQSLEILPNTSVGWERYNSLLPLGLILGIIGPMPSEILNRVEFLPFFLEGMFILLAPFLIFLVAIKRGLHRDTIFLRMFFGCLLPAILILLVLHAPFGLLNPGSAIRWRVNFEQIFYLAPLLLMYRFIDYVPTKNNSPSP